jgi:hypothetical protein
MRAGRSSIATTVAVASAALVACGSGGGVRVGATDAHATTSGIATESAPTSPAVSTTAVSTTVAPTTTAIDCPAGQPRTPTNTCLDDPTTTTAAASSVEKTEEWLYPKSDSYYWGLILVNSGTAAATNVSIEADFYDASGRLVDTESGFLRFLLPNTPTPVTGIVYQPAAVPVRMEAKESHETDRSGGPYGQLTIDGLSLRPDDYSFSVLGEITSTFEADQENVQLTAIWKDPAGKVAYTEMTYLEHVPPNVPTAFTIDVFDEAAPRALPAAVLWST